MYMTARVVARHGATSDCSDCVALGPHKEVYRVRLEKTWDVERTDPVGTRVEPITESDSKSHEPAPTTQQESASSSSDPAASMPTQNLQNEQMDSTTELGPQERRERQGARPSETPTSEIFGRPVEKTRPASSSMIVPTAECSGTGVLSRSASSSKDEMTIGDLYVFDGIDVMTTLVPEEIRDSSRQQKRAPSKLRCRTKSRNQLRMWTNEDPSATEVIEAYDARTDEKLDSEEVRKDEPQRYESLMNSSQKCDRHQTRKSGQNRMKHVRTLTVQ